MKQLKPFLFIISGFLLLTVLIFFTPPGINGWYLITARGYHLPDDASIFSFTPVVMNQGSGEWWLIGEDRHYWYHHEGRKISKIDARRCPGFVAAQIRSWCTK